MGLLKHNFGTHQGISRAGMTKITKSRIPQVELPDFAMPDETKKIPPRPDKADSRAIDHSADDLVDINHQSSPARPKT